MRKMLLGTIFEINRPKLKKQGKTNTLNNLPKSFVNLKQ
jgi:hypothetical protein